MATRIGRGEVNKGGGQDLDINAQAGAGAGDPGLDMLRVMLLLVNQLKEAKTSSGASQAGASEIANALATQMQSASGQVQALVQAEFGYAVTVTNSGATVEVKIGGANQVVRGDPATVKVMRTDGQGGSPGTITIQVKSQTVGDISEFTASRISKKLASAFTNVKSVKDKSGTETIPISVRL